jgi:putative SOS response-associated peptidase YedK
MCGRFTLTFTLEQIEEDFDLQKSDMDWQPSYNVAPSQYSPVMQQNEISKLSILPWGINMFLKKINQKKMLINIRKETLVEKHSFEHLVKNKRCVIPASGFYEWEQLAEKSRKKIPYYFKKKDNSLMIFAGLWNERVVDYHKINEFAIITCPANETGGKLHNRMPVILDKSNYAKWLSNTWTNDLYDLLKPYNDEKMDSYMVSPRINNPDYNNLDCIKAIPIEQPGLGY